MKENKVIVAKPGRIMSSFRSGNQILVKQRKKIFSGSRHNF